MSSRMVRLGIPAMMLLVAACNSGRLPGGESLRVIHETLPAGERGTYILVYRSSVSPGDCAAIAKELAEVWATVQPKVDGAKALRASITAEASNGASSVVAYGKSTGTWKQTLPVGGCEGR